MMAERLLQHAQEDSDAFWQDVNAALLKQVSPVKEVSDES